LLYSATLLCQHVSLFPCLLDSLTHSLTHLLPFWKDWRALSRLCCFVVASFSRTHRSTKPSLVLSFLSCFLPLTLNFFLSLHHHHHHHHVILLCPGRQLFRHQTIDGFVLCPIRCHLERFGTRKSLENSRCRFGVGHRGVRFHSPFTFFLSFFLSLSLSLSLSLLVSFICLFERLLSTVQLVGYVCSAVDVRAHFAAPVFSSSSSIPQAI
jgi:hypothetical protein